MPPRSKRPRNAILPPMVADHHLAQAAEKSGWLPFLLITAIALGMILPIIFHGNASGHDFEVHLASWMEAAAQWRHGIIYPRWAPGAHSGFGEPRFIFYPPLSWLLGAALGTLLPWIAVPAAFAWVALTLAGLTTYVLVRESHPRPLALWAAALYATNPYNVVNIYFRSAFAELLASAIFPLAVLFALRLARSPTYPSRAVHTPETRKASANIRNIINLALVVAAIWLTNAPAAVITSYSLALLFVVATVHTRSFRPLWRGAAAGALGLAIAGFYIVPAVYEQKWVHIADAFSSPLRPEDNFFFTRSAPFAWPNNDPQTGDEFNFQISWLQITELGLGIPLALSMIAAAKRWPRRRASSRAATQAGSATSAEAAPSPAPGLLLLTAMLALGLAAAVLFLRPSLPLWRIFPYLRNIQFPWRWLFVLNLAIAIGAAAGAGTGRFRYTSRFLVPFLWLLLKIYLLAGSEIESHHLTLPVWDNSDISDYSAAIASGTGYEGLREYLPTDGDIEQLPDGAPQVALANADSPPAKFKVVMEKWQVEEKRFAVESSGAAQLSLHLFNYPAWQVEVNGRPGAKQSDPDDGQLLVSVPAGRSDVRVFFARTPDRTAGGVISLAAITLIAAMFAALFGAGRHRPRRSRQNKE